MTTSFVRLLIRSSLGLAIIFTSIGAVAAIPRASFIVLEVAKHNGNGTYLIENDVNFQTASSSLTLREQWLVSSDGQMRLTVRSAAEGPERVSLQYVYGGGQRHSQNARGRQSSRIGEEFLEKFFHTRSRDLYFTYLVNLKILPASYLNHRPSRSGKDFIYPAEPLVRLARVGGTTAYALGEPGAEAPPMAWIEQDLFVLRKLRFPSGSVMTADRYASYPRDLWMPKSRHVTWSGKSAQLNLVRIQSQTATKGDKRLQASTGIELTSQISGISDPEMQKLVEEFYSRFR